MPCAVVRRLRSKARTARTSQSRREDPAIRFNADITRFLPQAALAVVLAFALVLAPLCVTESCAVACETGTAPDGLAGHAMAGHCDSEGSTHPVAECEADSLACAHALSGTSKPVVTPVATTPTVQLVAIAAEGLLPGDTIVAAAPPLMDGAAHRPNTPLAVPLRL